MPEVKIQRVYCQQCLWNNDGSCQLNPPVPLVFNDNGIVWDYPPVGDDQWCSFGKRLLTDKEIEAKQRARIAVPTPKPPMKIVGGN